MPRAGGIYSLPPGYLAVTGQTILASQHNPPLEDIANALTASVARDGSSPMLGNLPMNGYRATGAGNAEGPQDLVTKAQLDAAIAAVAAIPTGSMMFMAGNTIPPGWLLLNGQAISRTTFSALYAYAVASGNMAASQGAKTDGQFGPGNGTSTFSLPNLQTDGGQFLRSTSSGRGVGTSQADEIRAHAHSGTTNPDTHAHNYSDQYVGETGGGVQSGSGRDLFESRNNATGQNTHAHTFTTNSTGGAETRPKNVAYPLLIKT